MTKDIENKFVMSNSLMAALAKTKDSVGDKFKDVYKTDLEKRYSECEQLLTKLINGILGELSQIKILTDEITRIDEKLREQEE
jgi:hypothetical protein